MNGAGTASKRVERGAALLDEKRPGWWREIDTGILDIGSACNCIAGQVGGRADPDFLSGFFSAFSAGLDMLDISLPQARDCGLEHDLRNADLSAPGAHRLIEADYEALTAAWRDLIRQRLDSGGGS